jgi:hypothetical protein
MKKVRIFHPFLLMVLVIFAVNCGGGGGGGEDVVTRQVSLIDPVGDVVAGSKANLASGSVEQVGNNLRVTVKLAPGEFDPLLSYVDIVMDIDMNPATGYSTDAGLIGGEYIIEMGSACLGGKADILHYNSATTHWDKVGEYAVTFLADGMEVTVPTSVFNGYTGKFSFWVESAREIGSCSYTGRIDSMPDLGIAPAVFQ